MENEIPNFSEVGRHLRADSKDFEPAPRTVLQELFPYLWEASRRMSTRAISEWLEGKYGFKISQATVSRALRKPEKHWQVFSEFIEPSARIVAEGLDDTIEDVLFPEDDRLFEHSTREARPKIAGNSDDELLRSHREFEGAVEFLKKNWFCLSGQSRSFCWKFLKDEESAEKP
jgi:hypothetical protein